MLDSAFGARTAVLCSPGLSLPLCRKTSGKSLELLHRAAGMLHLPSLPVGLESVDHYPILVAVTGILVRLLVHGPASE